MIKNNYQGWVTYAKTISKKKRLCNMIEIENDARKEENTNTMM